jgi:hypothetical protein
MSPICPSCKKKLLTRLSPVCNWCSKPVPEELLHPKEVREAFKREQAENARKPIGLDMETMPGDGYPY